ncbi:MAG: helix-turn-helix domain-containing protein [Actinomycetes bacterium]
MADRLHCSRSTISRLETGAQALTDVATLRRLAEVLEIIPTALGITATVTSDPPAGFNGPQVWLYRWSYEPDTWTTMLQVHGFVEVTTHIEPAPTSDHVGTLVAQARRS